MKIAKTSWHYRFNRFNNENFEDRFNYGMYTTCSYIRTTLASMFSALFKCCVLLVVACFILGMLGSMIVVPILIFMGTTPPELPTIVCAICWSFTIGALLILLAGQIKEWVENLKYKSARPKKEPNVFVQAVIDKHNKFCTLVTAED